MCLLHVYKYKKWSRIKKNMAQKLGGLIDLDDLPGGLPYIEKLNFCNFHSMNFLNV